MAFWDMLVVISEVASFSTSSNVSLMRPRLSPNGYLTMIVLSSYDG